MNLGRRVQALGALIPPGPDVALPICPACLRGPPWRESAHLNAHRDRITRCWRCRACGHRWTTREVLKR